MVEKNKWFYLDRGIAFSKKEDYSSAKRMYKKAIRLAFQEKDNYTAVIEFYLTAIQQDPFMFESVWDTLKNSTAFPYSSTEKLSFYQQFIKACDKLLQEDPEDEKILYNKAVAYSEIKNHSKVVECLEKFVYLYPDNFEGLELLALSYLFLELYSDSEKCYQKLKDLNILGWCPVTWSNLGIVYEKLNQTDKAIQAYEKSVKMDPDLYCAWDSLVEIYSSLNKPEEEIRCLQGLLDCNQQLVTSDPDDFYAWYEIGRATQKLSDFGIIKEYDYARDCFKKAIILCEVKLKNSSHKACNYVLLGKAYTGLSEFQKAICCLKRALKIDPTFEEASKQLSYLMENYSKEITT